MERLPSDDSEEISLGLKQRVEDDGGIGRFVWHWMMNLPTADDEDVFAVAPGRNKFCLRGVCGRCGHASERQGKVE
jgi:hypothetical protein